jgi:hypothetical protein
MRCLMPTCDIVIVSYKKDLTWLYLSLRLLLKNWHSPSRIIVRLDEDCRGEITNWNLGPRVIYRFVQPWPDGYIFQMYMKLLSDDFTDADLIMLCDSDLMLLASASLDTVMKDGKPIIEYCDWARGDKIAERVWRGPTSRVMGVDLHADFMVQAPFLFWRDTFSLTRQRIVNTTGKGFFESVYSDTPFTPAGFLNHPMTFADYEALNLYAATFQAERYYVRPNNHRPLDWPFKLYWSHGGLTREIQAELDAALCR